VSLGRRLSFGHRFVGFALPSRSHRLPSGGAARVTLPPSGDRWLRRQVATLVVAIRCQAVVRRRE